MNHTTSKVKLLRNLFFILFNISIEYFLFNNTFTVFPYINNSFYHKEEYLKLSKYQNQILDEHVLDCILKLCLFCLCIHLLLILARNLKLSQHNSLHQKQQYLFFIYLFRLMLDRDYIYQLV